MIVLPYNTIQYLMSLINKDTVYGVRVNYCSDYNNLCLKLICVNCVTQSG